MLEVSAVDPQLGTVFYTMDMSDAVLPTLERQSDNCLICHASSHTRQVPGHMVRSVYTDTSGLPILSMGLIESIIRVPSKNAGEVGT